MKLFDIRMKDGSRHFGELLETEDWDALRHHLEQRQGIEIIGFVTDHVTEAWIDFKYSGYTFSTNNQHGWWWFFDDDSDCPDEILKEIMSYCSDLLG